MKRSLLSFSILLLAFIAILPGHAKALTPLPQSLTGVYRLYNPLTGEHFYTTDYKEAYALRDSATFSLEGVEGNVYTQAFDNSVPIFRLYSSIQNRHFYTTSYTERATVESRGFRLEGIIGHISLSTSNPYGSSVKNWHRLYSKAANDHFYTTDYGEVTAAESHGYTREGDMGYIY